MAQVAPDAEQVLSTDGQSAERPAPIEGARYNEPPLPPYDYWQPTWMPCQSLRINRSLVLGHLYWGMDILAWSTKGVHAPALVTTSPAGTAENEAGVFGAPGTTVLFGDETLNKRLRPGGRLTLGWWFDPNQYRGIEFQYMELDSPHRFQASSSGGSPILARPIVDANSGDNASVLTSFPTGPNAVNGSITIDNDLQLTSTGILFRDMFWASQIARVDYLVGYRHAHLFDRVHTFEDLTALGTNTAFTPGDTIIRRDQFRAINQFDGADFGFKGWWSPGGTLALTSLSKIAIGATNNNVLIDGFTRVNRDTPTRGGVLALPSNIGGRAQQDFGYIAELGGGLEWRPACYWKFSLGYTWFYWNQVARAASQISTTIDRDQLAPTNSTTNCGCPAFHMHLTSFWAQGLNGGFQYQF